MVLRMNGGSIEILCPACGNETLLLREPVYDGFKRTGEALKCAGCGHTFASEAEVPFKHRRGPVVFTEADRSRTVEVFREDEKGRICRYCQHYVVNPFRQYCGRHRREVEATDSCNDFTARAEKPESRKDVF